jgi:hypothetical protein
MIHELRQYTIAQGRMEELHALFREVVDPLIKEVGIRPIAYWEPVEPDGRTFVYLVAFDSVAHRTAAWKAFADHPKWQAAKAKFPGGVPPYEKIVSTLLAATDYSPSA